MRSLVLSIDEKAKMDNLDDEIMTNEKYRKFLRPESEIVFRDLDGKSKSLDQTTDLSDADNQQASTPQEDLDKEFKTKPQIVDNICQPEEINQSVTGSSADGQSPIKATLVSPVSKDDKIQFTDNLPHFTWSLVPEAIKYKLTIKNSKGEIVSTRTFDMANKKLLSNVITENQTLCANWIAPLTIDRISKGSCTTEKISSHSHDSLKNGVCWVILDKNLLDMDLRYLPQGKYEWQILSIINKDKISTSNPAEFTVGIKPLPSKPLLLTPTGTVYYNPNPVFKWTSLYHPDPKKNVTHYFIWVHEITFKRKNLGEPNQREEIVENLEIIAKRISSEEANCSTAEKICSIQFEESVNSYSIGKKGKWWVSGENSFGPGPKATAEFSSQ